MNYAVNGGVLFMSNSLFEGENTKIEQASACMSISYVLFVLYFIHYFINDRVWSFCVFRR